MEILPTYIFLHWFLIIIYNIFVRQCILPEAHGGVMWDMKIKNVLLLNIDIHINMIHQG